MTGFRLGELQMLESLSGFSGGTMISDGLDKLSHVGFLESRKRKDDRALDKDEEDYFNEDRYKLGYRFFGIVQICFGAFSA